MSATDTAYFKARAEAERKLAKSSTQRNVAEIHEELARQYDALAREPALRPLPNEVKDRAERL